MELLKLEIEVYVEQDSRQWIGYAKLVSPLNMEARIVGESRTDAPGLAATAALVDLLERFERGERRGTPNDTR